MDISLPLKKSIFTYAFQQEKPYCFSNEALDLIYDHIVALPPNSSQSSYNFDEIRAYYKESPLGAFFRIYKEAVLDEFESSTEFPMVEHLRKLEPYDSDGVYTIVEKDIEQAKKIIHTFLESNDCFVGFVVSNSATEVSVVYESFL